MKKGRRYVKGKSIRLNLTADEKSIKIIDLCCASRNQTVSELFRTLAQDYARNVLGMNLNTFFNEELTTKTNDIEQGSNEPDLDEVKELERLKALRRARKEGALND